MWTGNEIGLVASAQTFDQEYLDLSSSTTNRSGKWYAGGDFLASTVTE
jgi:hypothetical protein